MNRIKCGLALAGASFALSASASMAAADVVDVEHAAPGQTISLGGVCRNSVPTFVVKPKLGTVSLSSTGNGYYATYTANANASGIDQFSFQCGTSSSAQAKYTVAVGGTSGATAVNWTATCLSASPTPTTKVTFNIVNVNPDSYTVGIVGINNALSTTVGPDSTATLTGTFTGKSANIWQTEQGPGDQTATVVGTGVVTSPCGTDRKTDHGAITPLNKRTIPNNNNGVHTGDGASLTGGNSAEGLGLLAGALGLAGAAALRVRSVRAKSGTAR